MQECRKKTIIRVLIIIPSLLLLIFGGALLGYYTFFPAKLKLQIAGYISTSRLFNCLDKNMDFLEQRYISPLMESTIKKETKVGISPDEELLSFFLRPDEAEEVISHINKLALKFESKIDVKNRKQSVKAGLSYLLNPILTARISFDGNKFNFGVDELSNRTITGDMTDLGNLSYLFPFISDEYWDMLENTDPWAWAKIAEKVEIDRKAVKKIILDYSREIISGIDSKNMTMKKQETEVLDKKLSLSEITVRLDENLQKELASRIIEKLSEDEFVYSLTAGNMMKALDVLSENRYYGELISDFGLTDIYSRDGFKNSLIQLKEEIQSASLEEITIKLYIDGFDIVKCEITTDPDIESYISYISFDNRINGPSFESSLKISYGYDGEDIRIHMKRDLDPVKDLSNVEFKLDMNVSEFLSLAHYLITVKSVEEAINKNEADYNLNVSVKFENTDMFGDGELGIDLKGTKTKNSKNQVVKQDYKGKLRFGISYLSPDTYSLGFYYDTEAVYGEVIEIPVPDDVLDLKTATENDFDQLTEEVFEKIEALMRLTGF